MFLTSALLYWITLAILIAVEHLLFAHRWRHYELARRAMGIGTVMLLPVPLLVLDYLDLWTWAVLCIGFIVAGGVTAGLYTNDWAREREEQIRYWKAQMGDTHATPTGPDIE